MNKKATDKDRFVIEGAAYWAEWLYQWRIWLMGAALGVVIALVWFAIAPPGYRAQATVLVDQNVEQAWTYFPDRQLFQFVRRETARLVELAWSDEVLKEVAQTSGLGVEELRGRVLDLSQPSDGGWHFMAIYSDAGTASELADSWALAFLDAIDHAIETDPQMQAARNALEELVLQEPSPDDAELNALLNEITTLAERVDGVSPYVEASLSQLAQTPAQREVSAPSYALAGGLTGMLFAAFFALLRFSALPSKNQ